MFSNKAYMPLKLSLLAIFLLLNFQLKALDYYWVGGSGKWSEYTLHWANSSGGNSFYVQVPSPFDNIIIDANSFSSSDESIELDQTIITCNSISFSTGNKIINLIGGTAASSFNIYGSLAFAAGIRIDYAGTFIFKASSSGNTIKQSGAVFETKTSYSRGNVEFNGPGGSWTLLDSLSLYYISLTNGTLNATGKKITCEEFHSSAPNVRTLNLTNARVHIGFNWDLNTTNLSGIFSGSSIDFNSGYRFKSYPGSLNYDTLIVSGNFANMVEITGNIKKLSVKSEVDGFDLYGNIVIDDFTSFTNSIRFSGDFYLKKSSFNNPLSITIGGDLKLDITDLSGANCKEFLSILGIGSITKTSGVLTLNYVVLKDIQAQGGASFFAQESVDMGGNTGWTFSLFNPATMYWVGGSGNWSDGTHWSYSSGGSAINCIPTVYNNVVFDHNSFSANGQDVVVPYGATCKTFNCSGSTYTPIFSGGSFNLYGSLLLRPGLDLSGISEILFLSGNAGNLIDFAHNPFPSNITIEGNGEWTLQDSAYFNNLYFNKGSLNTNGKKINCSYFNSNSSDSRVMNLGSSHITIRSGAFIISPTLLR
jgi:hypothetical protein